MQVVYVPILVVCVAGRTFLLSRLSSVLTLAGILMKFAGCLVVVLVALVFADNNTAFVGRGDLLLRAHHYH